MKKITLITLVILLMAFCDISYAQRLSRRSSRGERPSKSELQKSRTRELERATTATNPADKYDFNMQGPLHSIERDKITLVDSPPYYYNSSQIEAFDSLGRPVVFKSIDPPANVKLVVHTDGDKRTVTAIMVMHYTDEYGRQDRTRSVNQLEKIHSPAVYDLDENRITIHGEDGPPPIRKRNDSDGRGRPIRRTQSGLQIETE